MPEKVPAPPEGYMTIHTGGALHELPSSGPFRVADRGDMRHRTPIDGVLVYAEGDWRPVTGFRARFRRSVDLDYTDSPLADAQTHRTYQQRVVAERVAVRPDVIPQWIGMQERLAADQGRAEQRRREEAERQEQAVARRQADKEAERAARLAAMTPESRREALLAEIDRAEFMVEFSREEAARVAADLAEREAKLAGLRRQLDEQEGDGAQA